MNWLSIAWGLIKGNAGSVVGWFFGKWQALLVVVGFALFCLVSVYFWHANEVKQYRLDILDQYSAASVREANKEIARLTSLTNNLNEVYREQIATIDDLERRADDNRVRLTKSQRDSAIFSGTAEAVRHYAQVAGDVYQACRDEYRALGYEAARGAAAAYTLNDWINQTPKAKEFDDKLKAFSSQLKGQ